MSADKRTPEGRLLRTATSIVERELRKNPPENAVEFEVIAQEDGAILGEATWTRSGDNGSSWEFKADVMTNLKQRGGGYARLRMVRSW